ncbi:hypothetical protein [Tychonema sp. BBK16]|uniref:hypothetical protein n=1 Tax=Tychonema sp. BBK16 TaxID=2699888 RepID=UPI001F1A0920|nr:hypothetical protein [Tychonema sp. BBK16]MCF6374140.1 hypothetical protein [Tychonema sp. BBK16]
MKSKLFWSICTVVVASLPMPSFAQTKPVEVRFDYKGSSMKYQVLPGAIPDRTLPRSFDFPIITNVATDTSITSDFLITDEFRAPATRSEYTSALNTWAAAVKECMVKKPRLIRASTKNPVLFDGKAGTIVRNANNRAVCK